MKQIWKSIPGYEGSYEVSSLGEVRSLTRRVRINGGTRETKGVLLRHKIIKGGYHCVALCRDSRRITRTVHSLVMEAFVGPRPSGYQVAHEDDCGAHNSLGNLAYKTVGDNHLDKIKRGRTARGSTINTSKLVESQVVSMREERMAGAGVVELAEKYGVSTVAVSKICLGQNWKYAGGPIMDRQERRTK